MTVLEDVYKVKRWVFDVLCLFIVYLWVIFFSCAFADLLY